MSKRERATFSLAPEILDRIRQCGARNRGGASAYVERLVRTDAMAEAVAGLGQLYATPGYNDPDASEAELAAALNDDNA